MIEKVSNDERLCFRKVIQVTVQGKKREGGDRTRLDILRPIKSPM